MSTHHTAVAGAGAGAGAGVRRVAARQTASKIASFGTLLSSHRGGRGRGTVHSTVQYSFGTLLSSHRGGGGGGGSTQ